MDWLELLAVQGTLKSLLQHQNSKAWILQHSAFFIVQLSHPYMTTGKTIALTRRTFVGKVMSLLFNMLSRLGFIICGLMIKTVDSYMRIQWDHVKCQAHSRWSVMVEWKDWWMDDQELTEHQFALAPLHDLWDLPGIEPGPWQWEHGILATGPPGNSLVQLL